MIPQAILFGAIGTLVETSDLQRRAFNNAFVGAGLDWNWTPDEYKLLLEKPGGRARIADYAKRKRTEVDVDAIYREKQLHFSILVQAAPMSARKGVEDVIAEAKVRDIPVGLVTGTTNRQVDAILNALYPAVKEEDFAIITTCEDAERGKPAADLYLHAAEKLGVAPHKCAAIEDTPESAMAAKAAGVPCYATPGYAARGRLFPQGVVIVPRLRFESMLAPQDMMVPPAHTGAAIIAAE